MPCATAVRHRHDTAAGIWNVEDLPRPMHLGRGGHLAGTT